MNGDSTAGAGLQFSGLDQLIVTNITDMAGATLTLNAITTTCRTIVNVGGKPQALVISFYDNQILSQLILSSYYRLTQVGAGALADIPAGVAVSRWVSPFGTLDIIPERYIDENYQQRTAFVIDDKSITEDGNAIEAVALNSNVEMITDYIGGTPEYALAA